MDVELRETIPEQAPEEEAPVVRSFATVGAVYADGLSLIFDGEDEPTEKHYLCNTNVYFSPGDRVKLAEDSGTYVVEYVVGPPRQAQLVGIPAGGSANQVLSKASAADFDAAWTDSASEIPSSGTTGYVLTKTASGFAWQAVPVEIPATGTTGHVLTKQASGFGWAAAPTEIPASGTTGYVLTKTSSGFGWAAAPTEIPATGTTGYVLTKTASGFAWQAVPAAEVSALVSGTRSLTLNASGVLVPNIASGSSNGVSIGSSTYWIKDAYLGGNYGDVHIGQSSTSSYIGFYGATPVVRQTLSLTSQNMGYTSITSSNYLTALNNLVGILKSKLGLIG